ncbi:MAG: helix-turn-helix domain-containing protein [Chloroflexi bacterium]|nr:helix-turn-helix domain-containing protein [Chloroflexota bacterium]
METAAAARRADGATGAPDTSPRNESVGGAGGGSRGTPLPLRPRGGFGAYLHELRRERGFTVRRLAAAAGVHHTYVSKLERGDRQAPDDAVVEALAAALDATPAQLDQLRWRAGLSPRGAGAPGQHDPTLTLVAEAIGDPARTAAERDRLRRAIAHVVQEQGPEAGSPGSTAHRSGTAASASARSFPTNVEASQPKDPTVSAAPLPEAAPDGRAALLAGLLGGWQTLDEAAAELRVTPAYVWELVQRGQLRAWTLPGAAVGSPAGIRLRREDILALLQPIVPLGRP